MFNRSIQIAKGQEMLKFSKVILPPFSSNSQILSSENSVYRLYIFENDTLFDWRYSKGTWRKFGQIGTNHSSEYGQHVFSITDREDLIISTMKNNICLYLCDKIDSFLPITRCLNYFTWNANENGLHFGRFYNNPSKMGLIVVEQRNKVQFFEILTRKINLLFDSNSSNSKVLADHCNNNSRITLAQLVKSIKKTIICRTPDGICVFDFDAQNNLKFVRKVSYEGANVSEDDKIFFANLSGNENWMDIAAFNSYGLFLFKYFPMPRAAYHLINYNPMFSTVRGWKSKYTETVRFEDIDNDGYDDLIFTGPGGIEMLSFNVHTDKWNSLLSKKNLAVKERYTRVLHVSPPQGKDDITGAMFFTQHSGNMYLGNLLTVPLEMIEVPLVNKRFPLTLADINVIPEISDFDTKETNSILYLRDQNIWFDHSNLLNSKIGKPSLVLPLIGNSESTVKFHLSYDGSSSANSLLGVGWSTSQNFIISSYRDGNFQEDENYVLVLDDVPHPLEWLPKNSTSLKLVFSFKNTMNRRNEEKLSAEFFMSGDFWLVNFGNDHQQFYGTYGEKYGAIITDAAWTNWRGLGNEAAETVDRSNCWYLSRINVKGKVTYYEYEILRKISLFNHMSYNAGAFLKKVFNIVSEIRFFYEKRDQNLNLDLPSYLSGYFYKTATKEQRIIFSYTRDGKSLRLAGISQEADYVSQPLVKMKYSKVLNRKRFLEKITLPTGTEIIYNYTSLGSPISVNEKMSRKIQVSDDYIVSYGLSFTIVSFIDKKLQKVIIRMFTNDMSEEIVPFSRNKWPTLSGPYGVEAVEILAGESFFVVVIYNSPAKSINCFGNHERNWKTPSFRMNLKEEATVLRGRSFILVLNPDTNLFVFEWIISENLWRNSTMNIKVGQWTCAAVEDDRFVVYDHSLLYLGYKDANHSDFWTLKKLKNFPVNIHSAESILQKLTLDSIHRQALVAVFKENFLKISQNLVALSNLVLLDSSQLATIIRTFVIGRNHEVARLDTTIVRQDNLLQLVSDVETNENGDEFKLKYVEENGKFRVKLASVVSLVNKTRKELEDQINNGANMTKRFLLDLKKYHVSFIGQTIKCRNINFYFGGSKWHRYETPRNETFNESISIQLGDRFLVKKSDMESSLKLYDAFSNHFLFDLGVKELSETQINYPIYMAAQKAGEPAIVIEFLDSEEPEFRNTTLPKSIQLSRFGSAVSMVTHKTDMQGNKTVIIWPMYDIQRYLPNFVINSVKVVIPGDSGGSRKRITSYIYEEDSAELAGDRIYYNRLTIIPGSNIEAFGYMQMTKDSVQFFNGDYELVKDDRRPQDKFNESLDTEKTTMSNTKLYDGNGRFEIANFFPFTKESNMSDYIGFEDYEMLSRNWIFDREDIVKGRFSLTGKNYLHLEGKSLRRIFQPQLQDRHFIASCWIRVPKGPVLSTGDIISHLRALVQTTNGDEIMQVLGDIKYQMGNWYYAEVAVDLYFIQLALKKGNVVQTVNLEVEVRIAPSIDVPIDLDHIRFSSLDNIFDVNVYDYDIGKIVASIKSNGAITRLFYDKYLEQIAEVNESNQIKKFRTYTKDSFTSVSMDHPACEIVITPEKGFYEDFSPINLRKHWKLTNPESWKLMPAILWHRGKQASLLSLKTKDFDGDSCGIRFLYFLKEGSRLAIPNVITLHLERHDPYSDKISKSEFPTQGEILLVKENSRVILWINGRLYMDKHLFYFKPSHFILQFDVKIQEMMVFSRPQVQVFYKNTLNEKIQHVTLNSADSSFITQMLYDELGRQRMKTVSVAITRSSNMSVMAYASDLVTNTDPEMAISVWKTGRLIGKINEIVGHEFGFNEIVYEDNPLSVQKRIGISGEEFAANGKYGLCFGSKTSSPFILNQYPPTNNYTYQIQFKTDGREIISVFNGQNLKVASYLHVEGGKDKLSTFEYNENGLIIESLPPNYYERIGIFDANLNLIRIPEKFNRMEEGFAIQISYDAKNNPLDFITPDKGTVKHIFDDKKRPRFIIQYYQERPQEVESIVYFNFDPLGKLRSTGHMKQPLNDFDPSNENVTETNSVEFQRFYHSYSERDPVFRDKISRTVTNYETGTLYEESIVDFENKLLSKRYIKPDGSDEPVILSIDKRYEGDSLKEILYPATMLCRPFRVTYEHNKLGQMISVGVSGQPNRFMNITYNARNQIASQIFSPMSGSEFIRSFRYNDPGFLVQIDDKFLSQEILYTEDSYSNKGYGDGTITRIKFIAKWHGMANTEEIGLHENIFQNDAITASDSQRCFHELKREGYLDLNNQQTRIFYPDLNINLSDACTTGKMEQRVKEMLGKYGFPKEYGFRYDYGHFMQLRIAKYFVGSLEEETTAFQPDTFFIEIPRVSRENSQKIWDILKSSGYIKKDHMRHGRVGHIFLRQNLIEELININPGLIKYAPFLGKLLIKLFSTFSLNIPFAKMNEYFRNWFSNDTSTNAEIYNMLLDKMFLQNPIDSYFLQNLTNFSGYIPDIVRVMHKYQSITRTEFDMESIDIDVNGNHVLLNNGFENYQFLYESNSNRIREIVYWNTIDDVPQIKYAVGHNSQGNMNKALHKGIFFMEYHPVSNLVQRILMNDGKIICFSYDSNGERALKQVLNKNNQLVTEKQYIRDEDGRTLVERKLFYVSPDEPPDVLITAFIYDPKSLVGFMRRDQFYSVITDHQNSVRLVIRDGEVVAAYDYSPYGSLMRIYGSNPDAHISYRFTGQEWDSDIGLYNFHARLYDPTIGRFYQIDPMMQFYSPYKYAENSPVSAVDPHGLKSFKIAAFAIAIPVFALIGAYLASAAVNDSFNPLKWNWFRRETYLAIFVGATTGALIPIGYYDSTKALVYNSLQSAATVTAVGLFFAHLNAAAKNHGKLNPMDWDYHSPKTGWAIFEGFSMGVGILGALHGSREIFIALSRRQKYIFGGIVASYGGFSFTMGGINTNWNIKSIEFWQSILTGVVTAPDISSFGKTVLKFIKKRSSTFVQKLRDVKVLFSKTSKTLNQRNVFIFYALMDLIYLNGAIVKLGLSAAKLLIGSFTFVSLLSAVSALVNGNLENWDLTRVSTYHNLLAATLLTTKYYDITKTSALVLRRKDTMPTPHLSDVLRETHLTYAALLAEAHGHGWKNIQKQGHSITKRHIDLLDTRPLSFVKSFSTFILLYIRKRIFNPSFIVKSKSKLKNNATYGIARDDLILVQNFTDALQILGRNLKRKYKKKVCQEFNNKITTKFRISYDETFSKTCQNIAEDLFQFDFNRDFIISSLNYNLKVSIEANLHVKSRIENKRNQLRSVEEQNLDFLDFEEQRELSAKKIYLQIDLKNFKKDGQAELENEINELSEIFWRNSEEYRSLLQIWQFKSCSEPPLMLPPSFAHYFPKSVPWPNAYKTSHRLNWLSSYKSEEVPNLQSFQQCYNCINVTSSVRNIVRDLGWLILLNTQFLEKGKEEHAKKRNRRSFTKQAVSEGKNEEKLFISTEAATTAKDTTSSFLELCDNLFSNITNNKNLLFFDVLLAKYGNRKIHRVSHNSTQTTNLIGIRKFACEAVDLYEKSFKFAAKAFGLKLNHFNPNNSFELYEKIILITKMKNFDKIFDLILEYARQEVIDLEEQTTLRNISSCVQMQFMEEFNNFELKSQFNQLLVKHLKQNNNGE